MDLLCFTQQSTEETIIFLEGCVNLQNYPYEWRNTMILQYPMDFIKQAKKLYPYWTNLHECLDSGSDLVGRYLETYRCESKEKNELFEKWKKIFEAQNQFD